MSVEWFLVSVLCCWFVCHHTAAALVGVRQQNFASCPGGNDLTISSFGDIAIVYMLHLRHFLLVLLLPSFDRFSSSSCPLLVRAKACVGSIDRPFVLSSRRPFVFIDKTSIPLSIAVLFWSWSRRCHDRCSPIDRCFCSHRRVVFVAYTPTPRSIDHA